MHEGQTLAVLEVPELDAEVAGAQAGITQTQQNIERLQNEVAEEVVKRSSQKRGTIREHQEIGLLGIRCPRTQIAPTLYCAS